MLFINAPANPIKARARFERQENAFERNHPWVVVRDPSGDFLGRRFLMTDVEASARMMTWPEGIVFRHKASGEIRAYSHGAIFNMGKTLKPIYKLFFNDKAIFASTQKRAPKTVLRRYWPEIADDKDALDNLPFRPIEDSATGWRLEWREAA